MDRKFQHFLPKKVRVEILEQLRKANWTYERVQHIAQSIAPRIKLIEHAVIEQFNELAVESDDGCQISMKDIHDFLFDRPENTPTG